MLYILFNMGNKTVKELVEETGYSRQCISRITKLFRDKLFDNPEFYYNEEEINNNVEKKM